MMNGPRIFRKNRIGPKPCETELLMTDIDLLSRHFLALYFLFIGVHYTSVALGRWRRSGQSHIHYGQGGSTTWWVRQVFNLFRALILGVCIARVFWPIDPWLGVFPALYQPPLLIAGMVLLLASFSRIDYVHAYMQPEWRSGVDVHDRTDLLMTGPFSRSRNPIFLAVMAGQLGLFLTLPSVFTLLCLAVGIAMIRLQAGQEERALDTQYGDRYSRYRHQVARWF